MVALDLLVLILIAGEQVKCALVPAAMEEKSDKTENEDDNFTKKLIRQRERGEKGCKLRRDFKMICNESFACFNIQKFYKNSSFLFFSWFMLIPNCAQDLTLLSKKGEPMGA